MIKNGMKGLKAERLLFRASVIAVNLAVYFVLRFFLRADLAAANLISAFCAAMFFFAAERLFLSPRQSETTFGIFRDTGIFFLQHAWMILAEPAAMLILCSVWGAPEPLSKAAVQILILILAFLVDRIRKTGEKKRLSLRDKKARLYFAAGFGLAVLIAGIGFIAHGVWPFGDKTVLIVDSLHQYLPFYTDLERKLASSDSLVYSFSGGLGYNFWSTLAYYMASPWNLLLVFVNAEHVCDFMDFVILLKIGLCGGAFSWYLYRRNPDLPYLPAAFGAAFALSNFVIGYYFNLMWLDSIGILPVVMTGIEEIVNGKSGRRYGISLFYGLWCNYYVGFMLCIFSCLYFLVRWISSARIRLKRIWKSSLVFAWYSLLAGVLAGLVLLPAFMGLSSSESMQGNTFPETVRFYTSFWEMMLNHFILLEPVNISDSQVGLNAYCTIAAVLMAVLYLFHPGKKWREKLAHYGLTALLVLSFSFNMLNYVWHGFHVQNGLPNRFAFLYVAMLLIMAYDAFGALNKYYLGEILAAFLLPAGFVIYAWQTGFGTLELEDYHYYATFAVLVLWLILLLAGKYLIWGRRKKYSRWFGRKSLCYAVFSLFLVAETAVNGVNGILLNGGVTRSLYVSDMISWQRMMAAQNDTEFYRSEVDRQRMRNVTMFVGGKGMVLFNSTMLESITDFCDSLGIEARTNKNGYLGVTKLINDVLGIKYIATPAALSDTMYQFRRIQADGELTLFKNDNTLPLGFMVKDSIRDWDIHCSTEPLEVQNEFVTLATGLDPIYVHDRDIDMEDGENYGIRIPENKQVYLCIDKRVKKIELNTPEYTKTFNDYTDHLYVINEAGGKNSADFTVTLKPNQQTVQAHVYTCANAAYQEVVHVLDNSPMKDIRAGGNRISGTVDALEAGILLLTVPYDRGWTIRVDGEKTEFEPIGEALTGVSLPAGEHRIEMKYTPPGLAFGSAASLVGLILLMLTIWLEKLHPQWNSGWNRGEYPLRKEDEAGAVPRYDAEKRTDEGPDREARSAGIMRTELEHRLAKEYSEDAWKDAVPIRIEREDAGDENAAAAEEQTASDDRQEGD